MVATKKRLGGYTSYWEARERLLLDGATPVASIDASRLSAGRHSVEVARSQWSPRGRIVVFRGLGGRIVSVELPSHGAPQLGARVTVDVQYPNDVELYRTVEGTVAAVRDGKVVGEYDDVPAARLVHPEVAPSVRLLSLK